MNPKGFDAYKIKNAHAAMKTVKSKRKKTDIKTVAEDPYE
jgi:hypothetical protein